MQNNTYFLPDALGSVRQLADGAGSVTLAQRYDPFGADLSSAGAGSSVYGFTGEQRDASGLVYLRARYYAPGVGRFINSDPAQVESNLYQYARSNPINLTDPSGLFTVLEIESGILGVTPWSASNARAALFQYFGDEYPKNPFSNRWGLLKLLLEAKSGDVLRVGSPGAALPGIEWSEAYELTLEGGRVKVGGQSLWEFTAKVAGAGQGSTKLVPWRNTGSHFYQLGRGNGYGEFTDADRPRVLPDVQGFSVNLENFLPPELLGGKPNNTGAINVIKDRYGNIYIAIPIVGHASEILKNIPSKAAGLANLLNGMFAVYEGYAAPSLAEAGAIPNEDTLKNILTGISWSLNANMGPIGSAYMQGTGGIVSTVNLVASTRPGAGLTAGFTYELLGKADNKWHELDTRRGVTKQDVINMLITNPLLSDCP